MLGDGHVRFGERPGETAAEKPADRAPGRLSITRADRDWVARHHPAPALLRRVDATLGLEAEDFAALSDWAASLS